MYQQNKFSGSKVNFRQASNCYKRVFEPAQLAFANKTKVPINCQGFWQIAISVLNKGKSATLPLINGPQMLSSASVKAKLSTENLSKNSTFHDADITLPVFPSRTNLKLLNFSIAPKMVKEVIENLALSRASGTDGIPVVVLKNCEDELSYVLSEFLNKCLKESCFPDC